MALNKEYVGDGVYIQKGEYSGQFILTTEDGMSISNTIYLETQHVRFIMNYIDKHKSDVY